MRIELGTQRQAEPCVCRAKPFLADLTQTVCVSMIASWEGAPIRWVVSRRAWLIHAMVVVVIEQCWLLLRYFSWLQYDSLTWRLGFNMGAIIQGFVCLLRLDALQPLYLGVQDADQSTNEIYPHVLGRGCYPRIAVVLLPFCLRLPVSVNIDPYGAWRLDASHESAATCSRHRSSVIGPPNPSA